MNNKFEMGDNQRDISEHSSNKSQRSDDDHLIQAKLTIAHLTEKLDSQAALIERQKQELSALRRRHANYNNAKKLNDALALGIVAGQITSPVSHHHLLEMMVETAATVIHAEAAALFLYDERSQDLTFEVAVGGSGKQVKKFRVPLGKGIAGYVAESQKPLVIEDVAASKLWYREIGEAVDYEPHGILCVPMFRGGQLSGVLELCNKIGANTFSPTDIETLSLFGNQAAVTIELSRTQYHIMSLIGEMLATSSGVTFEQRENMKRQASDFADAMDESNECQQHFYLTHLMQSIVQQGENKVQA
jgi:signal transduction protein with GAF and PtsI domain